MNQSHPPQTELFLPDGMDWIPARIQELKEERASWMKEYLQADDDARGNISLILVHLDFHIEDLARVCNG